MNDGAEKENIGDNQKRQFSEHNHFSECKVREYADFHKECLFLKLIN
jgi:hypothetical protein